MVVSSTGPIANHYHVSNIHVAIYLLEYDKRNKEEAKYEPKQLQKRSYITVIELYYFLPVAILFHKTCHKFRFRHLQREILAKLI